MILNCTNVKYRFGLTGSAEVPDDQMKIEAALGPVIYRITPDELMRMGFLARPTITMFKIDHSIPTGMKWPDTYQEFIVDNEERNNKIVDIVLNEKDNGLVVVLIERIDHGKNLYDSIMKRVSETDFIHGELSTEERDDIMNRTRKGEVKVLIATRVLSEGIDLPNATTLINASGGGVSSVPTIQKSGRILRLHENAKKIYDFYDTGKYLIKHSKARFAVYSELNEVKIK